VREADDSLRRPGAPPSPGVNALFDGGQEAEQQMYITFDNGRIYLVTAHAPSDELNEKTIARLRQLVEQTREEVPGVNAGLTGGPVLDHDEMAQSERDTSLASVVSLVLCALIFIYGYNEMNRPIKATFCLLVGLAYTLGFATLVIGHLNILTITFLPILIGLAIDFGVHLVTRFEEELRRGRSQEEAMTKAIVFTGQGIFTGGFTTAGAFLAMGLTDFKGIQEMGIICGGGLLVCLVPMMTLLPVLLLRGRQNLVDQQEGDPFAKRARLERLWLNRPVTVVVVVAALCGLAASQFRKVRFDYNLLDMQSQSLPSVVFEKKLIDSAGKTAMFAAVIADSLPEAKVIEDKVKDLPAVASVESMSHYLNEDPAQKLQIISKIRQEVAPLQFAPCDRSPVRVENLSLTLYSLQGFCGAAADEAAKEDPDVARQLRALRDAIIELRKHMLAQPRVAAEKIAAYQQALFEDVHQTFRALATQDDSGPLRVKDLPAPLRNRFVGIHGQFLIQVYPKDDLWQRANQREFIRELRTALTPNDVTEPPTPGLFNPIKQLLARLTGERPASKPDQIVKPIITGTPVQLYEYTGLLVNSYIEAAWLSLVAIVLLVFIHFRTLASVVMALLPVAVGSVWLAGIMGGCGILLNPANIMTLPLVIGIGVTNGIHILNRAAEERVAGILAKSTGKAVLVSGLTSIAGFGSLILAKHQGIHSLGLVMATGIAACMIAGLTLLPAVMSLTMRFFAKTNQPSADNERSTLGREEPRSKTSSVNPE
jgi:predicted RND superfamily exporter protein